MSWTLDRRILPADTSCRAHLLIRLVGPAADPAKAASRARPALNLALVIDRSGSMAGDKLQYTKSAACWLVDHLGPADRLAVVAYDDRVETIVEPAPLLRKDPVRKRIRALGPGGMTNLSGAWQRGADHVASLSIASGVNRVVLLTDGRANQGVTDLPELERMAKDALSRRLVQTTTIGFGEDFSEDLLIAMARAGGGNFHFIERSLQAPVVFARELGELCAVHAKSAMLEVVPERGVSVDGFLNDFPARVRRDGVLEVELGDLFDSETTSVVARLSFAASARADQARVAAIRIFYEPVAAAAEGAAGAAEAVLSPSREGRETVVTVCRADEARAALAGRESDVVREVALLEAAAARMQALGLADRGDRNTASSVLRHSLTTLRALGDAVATREAAEMEEHARGIEGGAWGSVLRKRLASEAFASRRGRRRSGEAQGDEAGDAGIPGASPVNGEAGADVAP